MVVWLENMKIRFMKKEERGPLSNFKENWAATFSTYLTEIGSPYTQHNVDSEEDRIRLADWLLLHAISLEYADNAAKYNEQAKRYISSKQIKPPALDTTTYKSQEFENAIQDIAKLLHIPIHSDLSICIEAVERIVRRKFSREAWLQATKELKAVNNSKNQVENVNPGHIDSSINHDKFPLGFDTGENEVNRASTILRLLYISDLRELQTRINDAVVTVQGFTADPRTNSKLGKIGR
eukprot:TRINITY_DN1905_c0_g1_i1.p1 TRINITY_DN1905_c0_g1~~TRINITY_DN1905_c0_g1_i1.p1  ORF type:complete len:237 (+),score=59.89 TRINITY_DN1905_c0_g1_i1:107-817(+)